MKKQNFKNHTKWVFGYHVITSLSIIALLIGAIINFINASDSNTYSASLIVLVAIILLLVFYFVRAFALKAQDRAIRAEEKLRYYVLTNKVMNSNLKTNQIVALRFAPDDEFVDLANKAAKENLSVKDIKSQIKNWKADHYRA